MTRFFLIRHGTTDAVGHTLAGWRSGVCLNEEGLGQARRLAAFLAGSGIQKVYSSPLERAVQTAEPLAQALNLQVETFPGLGEVQFGEWTGREIAGLEREIGWQCWNSFRSGTRAPGGELMMETQLRVIALLLGWRDRYPGEVIAVFSHADAIRAALSYLLGMPLDLMLRLEISPASVSICELGEYGPVLLTVNDRTASRSPAAF